MPKVDLHTHSVASPDGAITADQYRSVLKSGFLDCIAVTDHNRVDFAQKLQKQLGAEKIIVGEEIMTTEGEIVGLFLQKLVAPGQSLETTIRAIKEQGGVVYVPHPLETVRKGISLGALERIAEDIDIVESANGRAFFQNKGPQMHTWAHLRRIPTFASSDAHRAKALGKTYTTLEEFPSVHNLLELAKKGKKAYKRPSLGDVFAPKHAKIGKKLKRVKNA